MRRGEVGKSLRRADLSLAPTRIRFASGISRDESNSTAFLFPVERSDDAALRPTLALNHLWRNTAGLSWQPLGMLNLSSDLTSTRDLRVYADSTPLGRLAFNERRFLLGLPVGVERDRALVTALSLTPNLATWLRPRFLSSSNFVLSRTLSSRDPVRADGDSGAFILPQTLNNLRVNELGASVDFARGLRLVAGDSSLLGKAMARVRPLDMSTRLTRTSTYDLSAFDPSLKYQLALGGLESFLSSTGADARGRLRLAHRHHRQRRRPAYGVTFTLSHALTRTTRFQRVGEGFAETETSQREWPVGNVRWSRTFRGRSAVAARPRRLVPPARGQLGAGQPGGAAGAHEHQVVVTHAGRPVRPPQRTDGDAGITTCTRTICRTATRRSSISGDVTGALSYAFRLPRSISRAPPAGAELLHVPADAAKTCLLQGGRRGRLRGRFRRPPARGPRRPGHRPPADPERRPAARTIPSTTPGT